MSASECITAHAELSQRLYTRSTRRLQWLVRSSAEKFDSQSFEEAVKRLIEQSGLKSDALLAEEDPPCKV
jgi:hypothetical protein